MKPNSMKVLRSGLGSLSIKIGNILLLFFITVLLARLAGATNYGRYSYVFAIVQIMAILAQVGLQVLSVREAAALQAEQKWGLLKGFVRSANLIILAASTTLVVGALLVSWITAGDFLGGMGGTFGWGLLLIPFLALANLRGALLRGLNHVLEGQWPEFLIRPGAFLLLTCGLFWAQGQGQLQPAQIMQAHVGGAIVSFALASWLLQRRLPEKMAAAPAEFLLPQWGRSALFLTLVAGTQVVTNQTDIVMLGQFVEDDQVGIYRVAAQVALLISFGLKAVNMVAGPNFSRLYTQKDWVGMQRLAIQLARMALAFAIPVVLGIYLVGRPLLTVLFGAEFEPAFNPLRILAVGQLVNAGMGAVVIMMGMTGQEKSLAAGMFVAAMLNILLNFILIPRFGLEGAALATVVSLVVWNGSLMYLVRRRLGISTWVFGGKEPGE